MGLTQAITDRLVGQSDDSRSLSTFARAKRWQDFLVAFPDLEEMTVLDVGGEAQFWRDHDHHPLKVTMVNPAPQPAVEESWIDAVVGDGCDLPAGLGEVDLVISNSVIEHVGGHTRRALFAEEIRQAAPSYWVQTPYRYFPIEPHFVFPFFQHLPRAAQARVAAAWPIGNFAWLKDADQALNWVQQTELIGLVEMRGYFPEATIQREHFCGLIKSLIAVRRPS